ncbi:MAG TPA: hypothetical protein VJU86_23265 [Pyrinomonadaceae bacterium]|nr:hypothetical protein [Pyrinomonadaceae bacterium]
MPGVRRLPANYEKNVFINCPFDDEYQPLFNAIVFAVNDMGFRPKSAKDESNAGDIRFLKIQDLIEECKYSIHDISRAEIDTATGLPRFNMPLELGLDLGCKRYGKPHHQEKVLLVLDIRQFSYRDFISDIAGQDIQAHRAEPAEVINVVRNWLRLELDPKLVITPGGPVIYARYVRFQATLPSICSKLSWDIDDLPFSDFSWAVAEWIANNPLSKA